MMGRDVDCIIDLNIGDPAGIRLTRSIVSRNHKVLQTLVFNSRLENCQEHTFKQKHQGNVANQNITKPSKHFHNRLQLPPNDQTNQNQEIRACSENNKSATKNQPQLQIIKDKGSSKKTEPKRESAF
tara:strand:- start:832 stop:1212 length:381 start_codon:yes stop_codon:yes gene_type:complete